MENDKSCSCAKHIKGIVCDVCNCVHHGDGNCCTATQITVGPSYAESSSETVCATFKPNSEAK